MMRKRLKIICDGSIGGTRVITPGGEEIMARNVRFSHNAGEIPYVTLDLIGIEFEGVAELAPAPAHKAPR